MAESAQRVHFHGDGEAHRAILAGRRSHSLRRLAGVIGIFTLALGFGGLPQSTSAAAQQSVLPRRQDTSTVEPKANQTPERELAVIIQSPSTNSRGYRVSINSDGSATAEIGGGAPNFRIDQPRAQPAQRLQQFPPGTIDTKTLRRLLTTIRDVCRIPTGSCAKSASFGTRTQISYAGKISGDLQCIRQSEPVGDRSLLQASQDLGRFVSVTLRQLKINDRRVIAEQ